MEKNKYETAKINGDEINSAFILMITPVMVTVIFANKPKTSINIAS